MGRALILLACGLLLGAVGMLIVDKFMNESPKGVGGAWLAKNRHGDPIGVIFGQDGIGVFLLPNMRRSAPFRWRARFQSEELGPSGGWASRTYIFEIIGLDEEGNPGPTHKHLMHKEYTDRGSVAKFDPPLHDGLQDVEEFLWIWQ